MLNVTVHIAHVCVRVCVCVCVCARARVLVHAEPSQRHPANKGLGHFFTRFCLTRI
jgi:hypothetical protein